jgi:hypothetical protein
MPTWSDFTLLEEKINETGGVLESAVVAANGLIIIMAGNHDTSGQFPTIVWEGVSCDVLMDEPSAPYQAGFYTQKKRVGNCPCCYWYYWAEAYHATNGRVLILAPRESGTIRFRADGNGVFYLAGRVFQSNVTPSAGCTVRDVSFAPSKQTPMVSGAAGALLCQAGDLVLGIGTDGSANSDLAEMTWSGPAYQDLMSKLLQFDGFSVRMRVWRVKAAGTVTLAYANCSAGRYMQRFTPWVRESTNGMPSPTDDRIMFEITAAMDAVGNVERPRWMGTLLHTLRHSDNIGVRASWTRETLQATFDPRGNLTSTVCRVVEQWAIPTLNANLIDNSDSMVFASISEAEARKVALDLNW